MPSYIDGLLPKDDAEAVAVLDRYREDPVWPMSAEDLLRMFDDLQIDGLVQRSGNKRRTPIGFIIWDEWPGRFRILNVSVHPAVRRQGVATMLLGGMMDEMEDALPRCDRIQAVVHERNMPVLCWLRSCGFLAVDTVRREFGADDGVLLTWERGQLSRVRRFLTRVTR